MHWNIYNVEILCFLIFVTHIAIIYNLIIDYAGKRTGNKKTKYYTYIPMLGL